MGLGNVGTNSKTTNNDTQCERQTIGSQRQVPNQKHGEG